MLKDEMIHSWYREMPGISFEDIVGMEAVRDQLEKRWSPAINRIPSRRRDLFSMDLRAAGKPQ